MRKQTEPLFDPDLDDLAVREAFRRLDDQPSAALDAAILAAARQAVVPVAPPAATAGASASADVIVFQPKRRWFAPIGLAASLTLAVGIAWHVHHQPESALQSPQVEIPAEHAEAAPAAPAADVASEPPASAAPAAPATPIVADAMPVPLDMPTPAPSPSPASKPIGIPLFAGEPVTRSSEPPKAAAPAAEAAPAAPAPAASAAPGRQDKHYEPDLSRIQQKVEAAVPEAKARHGELGGALLRPKAAPAQEPSLFPAKEASFLAAVEAVRQLLKEEQTVAAHAALARLRRDYPDKELPADLQALAQEIDRARDK